MYVRMYTHVCMYVRACTRMHVSMCVCKHACMYANTCIVYVYVCKYMYACIYVCIYLYTHVSNNCVLAQRSRVGGLYMYVQALRVQRVKDADLMEMGRSLNIFNQRLQNLSNASQLTTFSSTVRTIIGVQPTSKARRATNRSRENRTLSYGRNARAIQLLTRAKKQKANQNIFKNIKNNVNNYKRH